MSNRRRPRPGGTRSRLIAGAHDQGPDDCAICVALAVGDTSAALTAFLSGPVEWSGFDDDQETPWRA